MRDLLVIYSFPGLPLNYTLDNLYDNPLTKRQTGVTDFLTKTLFFNALNTLTVKSIL